MNAAEGNVNAQAVYERIYDVAESINMNLDLTLPISDLDYAGQTRFYCGYPLTHEDIRAVANILGVSADYLEYGTDFN